MTEFWAMVLFGTVAAIAICIGVAIVYCAFLAICRLRRPEPLAENESPV